MLLALTSEGSVTLTVENEDALMKPQKAGKELKIKCDLDLVNVSKLYVLNRSYV